MSASSNLLWAGRKNASEPSGAARRRITCRTAIPRTKIPQTLRHIRPRGGELALNHWKIVPPRAMETCIPAPLSIRAMRTDTTPPHSRLKRDSWSMRGFGGSITASTAWDGKHEQMPMQFTSDILSDGKRLRNTFNPHGLLNPQKILPRR